MKKLVVGCLVVLALVAVGGAIGTYWLYHKVRSTVAEFAEYREIPDLERQVQNASTFTPPASGELSAGQVERFVKVQDAVKANLGESFSRMQQRYKALTSKEDATVVDLPEILSAYRDLAASYTSAKRAQVDALNEHGFSLDEYRWVKGQVYQALGLTYLDVDVGKLVEAITSGEVTADPARMAGSVGPTGPDVNQQLVKPYEATLVDNVALASFGL